VDEHNEDSGASPPTVKGITIDAEVGIGNGKRPPIHLGRFWGVYWDEKHQNKDFALVRLPRMTAELERKLNKLKLERILSVSYVLVPMKYLKLCDKITAKENKKNVKRK